MPKYNRAVDARADFELASPLVGVATRMANACLAPPGPLAALSTLIFHRVMDEVDYLREFDPDAERFEQEMRLVAEHFRVLPLSEAVARLRNGTLPARSACVTFDDGYADNAVRALPILERLGIPATFFIATGYLDGGIMWNDVVIEAVAQAQDDELNLPTSLHGVAGLAPTYSVASEADRSRTVDSVLQALKYQPVDKRRDASYELAAHTGAQLPENLMMTGEQLAAMAASPCCELGGHTVNHPILNAETDKIAMREIRTGREQLSERINAPVRVFAYPNGYPDEDYGRRHVDMVREAGFEAAVTTACGVSTRRTGAYELARFRPWDEKPNRYVLRMSKNLLNRNSHKATT